MQHRDNLNLKIAGGVHQPVLSNEQLPDLREISFRQHPAQLRKSGQPIGSRNQFIGQPVSRRG